MKVKSKNQKSKFKIFYSVLLYYSVILSTILVVGGFYTAKSGKEIISNFLFLPIVIFLWMLLIQKRRKSKKTKNPDKNSSRHRVKKFDK